MTPEQAVAFDTAVRELVAPFAHDDAVRVSMTSTIAWGHPLDPDS